ncbi:Exopolygalacturonase (Fragment) [Linum grandiflorum]
MDLAMGFAKVSVLLLVLGFIGGGNARADDGDSYGKVFNVMRYGAKADGKTDNSEAFLRAWKDGCEWNGKARILVPPGRYMSDAVEFSGPCKGSTAFIMKGLLTAPDRLKRSPWIAFRYVDNFILSGYGTFDARGYTSSTPKMPDHSLSFAFITNGTIHHIRSIDARNVHMELFACDRMLLSNIRIKAPADSHNTDGIKLGSCTNVRIENSVIETGDDCVAILGATNNLNISKVFCGPGHGISIGSLGYYPNNKDDVVTGVTVNDCTFQGTSDGVRIKSWASPNMGLVSNITYRNIRMQGVQNPIVIDQFYCPYPPCDQKVPSHIKIQDITYDNIWGTSKNDVAMKLNCSSKFDCRGVVMKDINLAREDGKSANATCNNVFRKTYGVMKPACP